MKMYKALKHHQYLWQVFILFVIMGFNTHHALAAITHDLNIGCPGTPVPTAPTDLMRVKGDGEIWSFALKQEPGVTIDHQVWTYQGTHGGDPNWGTFVGGDGSNELTWESPNIADHFTIDVKAKRHCAGNGGGEDDFEITWEGDVTSVIIKRDGMDITEPQDNPQSVKVGQMIKLTAEVQHAPANANITYQWLVPGSVIRDWLHIASANSEVIPFPFGEDQKDSQSPQFAWIDGGDHRQVSVTVTVNGVNIPSAVATFNVERPVYTLGITKQQNVEFVQIYPPSVYYPYGMYALADGDSMGVKISMVNVPQADQDNYEFLQIVTQTTVKLKSTSLCKQNAMPGGPHTLDTYDPYPKFLPPDATRDAPAIIFNSLYNDVFIHDEFSDFLMYKPPGAEHTDSIWIPLSTASWKWQAHAIKNDGAAWLVTDLKTNETITPSNAVGSSTMSYPGGATSSGGYGWTENIKNQHLVDCVGG